MRAWLREAEGLLGLEAAWCVSVAAQGRGVGAREAVSCIGAGWVPKTVGAICPWHIGRTHGAFMGAYHALLAFL